MRAITGEWGSLVNPERDLGPSTCTGSRALLDGQVVVAHNKPSMPGFFGTSSIGSTGDVVAFTGQLDGRRADPDSLSGKARKARQYDIPIVTADRDGGS